MDREERVRKIEEMEEILDKHSEFLGRFRGMLDEFSDSQQQYNLLKEYYTNGEYLQDIESYDQGDLPQNIKCGVLSEDAVFDLIGDNFQIAVKMLEIATGIIKEH